MFSDPQERKRVLDDIAWNWKGVVSKTLEDKFERTLFFRDPSETEKGMINLYRLLALRTWTMRYKLPLAEVLGVVLKFWDSIVEKRRRRAHTGKRGLGCTIPALCGDRSEEILEEYIRKTYPHGEHLRDWKEKKKTAYVNTRAMSLMFKGSLSSMVKHHLESVESARERNQVIASKMKNPVRRYPDNPWL